MSETVNAEISAGPFDPPNPQFSIDKAVSVNGRVLEDDGISPVQGSGVSFLFRYAQNPAIQIQMPGIWDSALRVWTCSAGLFVAGRWDVKMICRQPVRETDWLQIEVASDLPDETPTIDGSIWVGQAGHPLVTMNGIGISGVRIGELPEATDLRDVTVPGVGVQGEDVRVPIATLIQGIDEVGAAAGSASGELAGRDAGSAAGAIAGADAAPGAALAAVAPVVQQIEVTRQKIESSAASAALSEKTALNATDVVRSLTADAISARDAAGASRDVASSQARTASDKATIATAAANTASVAATSATVSANLWPDTSAETLSKVSEGSYFNVVGTGGVYASTYRKTSGAAVFVRSYPSAAALDEVARHIQSTSTPNVIHRLKTAAGFTVWSLRRRIGTAWADLYLPGSVVLARDPIDPLDAPTMRWVQATIANSIGALSNIFLPRSGGALTGALSVPGATLGSSVRSPWWTLRSAAGFVIGSLDKIGFHLPGGLWRHDGTLLPRGPVQLPGDPVAPLHAATKQYVDSKGAAATAAYTPLTNTRVQMTTRAGHMQGTPRTDVTECNMRLWMPASDQSEWHDVVLRIGNHAQDGNSDGVQPITYTFGIEYPSGDVAPVWFGGTRAVTVPPGSIVESFPLPIPITGGFWLRMHMSVPAGGTFVPSLELMQPSEGSGANFGSATDQSLTGTIAAGYGYAPFIPLAVLGRPSSMASKSANRQGKSLVGVGLLGDSIMTGTGDVAASGGSSYLGFGARACALAGIGYSRISVPGQRFNNFDLIGRQRRRLYALVGCSHVLCNFGTNDITQGVDLPTLKARSDALAARIQQMGRRYIPVTLTPRTNATNNGFYGSDTADSVTLRLAFNDYLRTNPYKSGVYDLAALLSDGANPQYWNTAYGAAPSDGLHPTTAMASAAGTDLAAKLPNLLA